MCFPNFYQAQPHFHKAEVVWADGPSLLTCGLSRQGHFAQKGLSAGPRWPDAASLETTSSAPLMRACTVLQEIVVTSWLEIARNTPSRLSVSLGH